MSTIHGPRSWAAHHNVGSTPIFRMTGAASRAPATPARQGRPTTSPYCQEVAPSRRISSSVSSGEIIMIIAPNSE
jgi:hypothetical protein